MDLHLSDAQPTAEERGAVDAVLGEPESGWDGGRRDAARDGHVALGGGAHAAEARRHLLLPALQALQRAAGWISEGGLTYVCARLTVPPAEAWGVATFYGLLATEQRPRRMLHVCDDIACRTRGSRAVVEALEREVGPACHGGCEGVSGHDGSGPGGWLPSPCLGLCDQAPAALLTVAGPRPFERLVGAVTPVDAVALVKGRAVVPERSRPLLPQRGDPSLWLLGRVGVVDPTDLAAYEASGGYRALRRALAKGPEAVLREILASRLVGRGGAAFPALRKWEAVARQIEHPHYVICNADESEPGSFKDRVLLEEDPFNIVEAMTIAGFAVGAERGFVYLRGEYPLAAARMEHAIAAAREARYLGRDVLGAEIAFDIEIRRGSGAYVCGEETAIFNSIEGLRGEPRNKPPFPADAGLWGKPTLVNNVETLASVPLIVLNGGANFASTGTGDSTGTKLFCLSGAVERPGVYEVPFGTTLRAVLDLAGAPPPAAAAKDGRGLVAVLLGGAAGTFVRGDATDFPLTFEGARAAGATLGAGVVMAFDHTADLTDVLLRIAAFFRDESCGQCVPCRVGTVRQEEALHRLAAGKPLGTAAAELALLEEIGTAMKDASICGLGQTASFAVESAIRLGLFGGGKGGRKARGRTAR